MGEEIINNIKYWKGAELQFKTFASGWTDTELSSQFLKNSNETQASYIFFFTLLVMLGVYEPTCIEIPALSFWKSFKVGEQPIL